jgi:hypothetical protein
MSPYIKQENREKWTNIINDILNELLKLPENEIEGELNYVITSILKKCYKPKYFNYNRLIGLLECIKQEMYRKVIGEYENQKEIENGRV